MKYIQIPLTKEDNDEVLIDISYDQNDFVIEDAGEDDIVERLEINVQKIFSKLSELADTIGDSVNSMENKPKEYEVEFAAGLTSDAKLIIAKIGAEASFRIKLCW